MLDYLNYHFANITNTLFFISKRGQPPAHNVACILKNLRGQSCFTVVQYIYQINKV